MFFYILYKLGYIISNILPLRAAYWLAERFSDIHFSVAKKDREAVAQNLSIVLKKDIEQSGILARRVFRNFGLYLVDFFRMGRLNKKILKRMVRVEGIENLDAALKKKKGVIALTCHIGNWEMGGVVTAMLGYDISAVVLTHHHRNINGILALAADRDFTDSGVTLDFFGVPTSIPKGPAMLSLKTGSSIVPAFFIRDKRLNYKLIFGKPIEVTKTPGIKDDEIIKRATEGFIPIMEKYIRQYPEQAIMPWWN